MTNECAPRNLAKMTNLFQVAPDVAPEKTRNQAKDICRPYPILQMQLSFFPDSISLVLFQLVCRPCSNQLKAGPDQPLKEHIHHTMNSEHGPWKPLEGPALLLSTVHSLRISTSFNPTSSFFCYQIHKKSTVAGHRENFMGNQYGSWVKWNLKSWQLNSGGWLLCI